MVKDLNVLDLKIAPKPEEGVTKYCNGCKQTKVLSEFYTRKDRGSADRYGKMSKCKACNIGSYRKWYRSLSPEQLEEVKRKGRKARYLSYHRGISDEEADSLSRSRVGLCEICGYTAELSVDHNHGTGKKRGLLCLRCNMLLGYAQENMKTLCHAIEYLYKYSRK